MRVSIGIIVLTCFVVLLMMITHYYMNFMQQREDRRNATKPNKDFSRDVDEYWDNKKIKSLENYHNEYMDSLED